MKCLIELKVNGEKYEIMVEPNRTLLEVLREQLDLTGTKEACDTGECGACSVLLDGKAALSCLLLAAECTGKEITTIEGISKNGVLDPIQKAFVDKGAFQCGFCTPGMVISAKALLKENPRPTKQEIKEGLNNVLCRCGGYVKYIEAVQSVAKKG